MLSSDPDYSDTDWAPIGYVAGRVGLSLETLYRWVKAGKVGGKKMLRRSGISSRPSLHLRVPEVREYIARRKWQRGQDA